MPRHASYLPKGVIPAVLLPFDEELSIDERSFRQHLRDVASTEGLSALTINAHSTEVSSCPAAAGRARRSARPNSL
jgi:4-hydroxy-tetrahydrodipicolinate synthase